MPPLAMSSRSTSSVASSSFLFGFSKSSASVDSSSSSSGSTTSCSNNKKDASLLPSIVVTIAADNNNSNCTADYKAKNALAKMEGSLAALLSFLAHHGLSQASVKELENSLYNAQYLTLMKRLEEYLVIFCLADNPPANNNNPALSDQQEFEAAIFLLLSAWQALCTHVNLLHRQAHRDFTRLQGQPRHRWPRTSAAAAAAPYQHHQHHQQPSGGGGDGTTYTNTTNTSGSMQFSMSSHKELVRTSLIRLTNLAEQSCDCQKGYLLAQRQWKRKAVSSV